MEPLLHSAAPPKEVVRLPQLPFPHAFCPLPEDIWRNHGEAVALSQQLYGETLRRCAIVGVDREGETHQSAPYNFLLRRAWMLLVPRRREHFGRISVNGPAYAGSLFVRDDAELQLVAEIGPMEILAAVSLE